MMSSWYLCGLCTISRVFSSVLISTLFVFFSSKRSYSSLRGSCSFFFFFFFSSRRRHTRLQGDWSSDVCSSDLSRTPLDLALGIARRHRATLTLLHVMRGLSLRVAEGLPAGVDADVQRWRLAEVRAALIRRVPREDRSMVRVDVRAGDVVEGVLNGAATTGAELIVMGGRPGASLVRETMRRAPCPVLAA